jgi:mRNA interferase MazF
VVVSFPFSDLSDVKLRPALVVADAGHGEFILCQLTSQSYHPDAVEVRPGSDVSGGKLRSTSYVRPLKLFTANASVTRGVIGRLCEAKLAMVVERIIRAIDPR